MTNQPIISVKDLVRTYHVGSREIPALRSLSMDVGRGKLISLRGRSGSGKTTLLNCIGGLDKPNGGTIHFDGRDITRLPESKWVDLRRKQIGFVFQAHALMASYTARENIDLMLRLSGMGRRERRKRTDEVLTLMGLQKWMEHCPFEMSGGQQQRVTIARAIAPRPALILADEPTGALDTATGQQILRLFRRIADEEGTTVLLATHDLAADAYADAVFHLQDGQIISDKLKANSC